MVPKFIPTTLAAISPTLDLEEAINRAAGPGPHDYSLFKRWSDDTLTFKINGEMMSPEEAAPHIEARVALHRKAAEDILEALQAAQLKAYVMKADDSSIWQIPRFYFYRKKAHQLALAPFEAWNPEFGEDRSMYGQPVLVSETQFGTWFSSREANQRAADPVAPLGDVGALANFLKGVLPVQAKRSHRAHEQFAHQAAALIRETGISAQRAFEQVAPVDQMRKPESVASAIRRTFVLMYDLNGLPHKI